MVLELILHQILLKLKQIEQQVQVLLSSYSAEWKFTNTFRIQSGDLVLFMGVSDSWNIPTPQTDSSNWTMPLVLLILVDHMGNMV